MDQSSLYVHPVSGDDRRDGRAQNPLKTLTTALERSVAGTTIHLAAGLYSTASGERFPLVIGPQRRVVGAGGAGTSPSDQRPAALLQGGGTVNHGALGLGTATCVLEHQAQLEQVTVINTAANGVGLWITAGRPIVQNVHLLRCGRYGIAIADGGLPTILAGQVAESGVCGIALFRQAKGSLVRVQCQQNPIGIGLYEQAAPLIQNCDLSQNQTGIVIAGQARPVLRGNRIGQNQADGVRIQEQAEPDLGSPWDLGENDIRDNGRADLNNMGLALTVYGNNLVPQRLQGPITLGASALPDPASVPAPRRAESPPTPPPDAPLPAPSPDPSPAPSLGSRRFSDLGRHWAGPFVDGLADQDLIKGFIDGSFRPNEPVTRTQFAALVAASFPQQPDRQAAVSFRDVSQNFWGAIVLAQAQRRGFLNGYPDGTMRPEQSITRIQAIVALASGLQLSAAGVEAIGIYRDRAQVPSYAVDGLAAATQQRIVVNAPEALELRPLEPITRAEVAALVYQGRVALGLSPVIASTFIVEPDSTQPGFSDLGGHWAADFIRGLATAHLVSGMKNGQFLPNEPMNRAQYAALVVKAFQPTPQRAAAPFRDVPGNFWAAEAVQAAYRSGFVSGFPDQTYGPSHPLLRVQVWVSLVEGLSLGEDITVDLNTLGQFTDYTQIPRYALRAVAIALAQSLIVNATSPTLLRPNQVATRAEVCAAVYQALVACDRLPPHPSPYIVTP
ncbi:S-layer homology domain-containing protein [Leptolyngbya sp. PCC 6406]|uniref:S-layer homology domain-containing protein n=1 Tax=Leptolyngbya sp. PCC 6406 TaxID=1173264 RepID=UPI0004829D8A|nr:S-layer homology domain-containing protein [Leptolyngbya sp. PCC 6406]